MTEYPHLGDVFHRYCDNKFFNYTLAKLAASAAHITPEAENRTMCEIFGAYGWAEGTKMMKWLTDFMLVRGINHFVPHAYSMKFPDTEKIVIHYWNQTTHVPLTASYIID